MIARARVILVPKSGPAAVLSDVPATVIVNRPGHPARVAETDRVRHPRQRVQLRPFLGQHRCRRTPRYPVLARVDRSWNASQGGLERGKQWEF